MHSSSSDMFMQVSLCYKACQWTKGGDSVGTSLAETMFVSSEVQSAPLAGLLRPAFKL